MKAVRLSGECRGVVTALLFCGGFFVVGLETEPLWRDNPFVWLRIVAGVFMVATAGSYWGRACSEIDALFERIDKNLGKLKKEFPSVSGVS